MNPVLYTTSPSSSVLFGASKKALAIVDAYQNTATADRAGLLTTSHAALVKANARLIYPNVKIRDYAGAPLGPRSCNPVPALEKLLKDINNGVEIGAVNVSLSVSVPLSEIKQTLGLVDLTPETVSNYREEILDNLDELNFKNSLNPDLQRLYKEANGELHQITMRSIELLSEIAGKGIPVFIAGGNEGPSRLNLLLLANGVTGVGALTQEGEKVTVRNSYVWASADNDLITEWERINSRLNPIIEDGKSIGFRLIRPNETRYLRKRPDLPIDDVGITRDSVLNKLYQLSELMGEDEDSPFTNILEGLFQSKALDGTSCASPQAAARYLKNSDD